MNLMKSLTIQGALRINDPHNSNSPMTPEQDAMATCVGSEHMDLARKIIGWMLLP